MMMTEQQRAEMTASCRDTDIIPKVWDAGKVIHDNGLRSQIMHNGLKVQADGYCGEWMTNIIDSLGGHHEPQEELLFFELLKHARQDTSIIELGSYWAYYSCWYLKDVPGSRAICIEPNPQHLQIGKKNAEMNGFQGRIEFKNAWVGHKHDGVTEPGEGTIDLDCLSMDDVLAMANDEVELLHVDIQGAELDFLRSMNTTGEKVRFLVLSTHHKSISGSSTTHRDCIQSILDLGGFIMDEHDIDESFSGDGLIVAGFHQNDRKIKLPPISRNIPENSLFPPEPFISYAQNFEDVMLWRALKHVKNGFYVDVGANDPVVDSVSKAFYDRGWRGVHIEPTPQYADLLRQTRVDETVLEVALSDFDGVIELNYMPGTGISTAIDAHASYYVDKHGFENRRIHVPALTLRSALRFLVGREVHWLKIDVEGLEEHVLKGWDSQALRPWVMVVEATIPDTSTPAFAHWEPILIDANYLFAYYDGLNRFYVASEHVELIPSFSSPPNVFDEVHLSGTANSAWCGLVLSEMNQHAAAAKQYAAAAKQYAAAAEQYGEQVVQAAEREQYLRGLLLQAASRENDLRQQLLVISRIHQILAERVAKGPLRLRQLVRHPKAFVREVFGIGKNGSSKKHTGVASNSTNHASRQLQLTLRWVLRQPSKAGRLFLRQPGKVLRYIARHPRKFISGKNTHSPSLPTRHKPSADTLDDLPPGAQQVYRELKKAIEIRKQQNRP